MSVDVLRAAHFIADRADWTRTNLELQKILYLAHMVHEGTHERPLVNGDFEAWELGPVHPTLYHHVKRYGSDPVGRIRCSEDPLPKGTEKSALEETYDALASKTGSQLVAITHWDSGAWARNYVPGERRRKIPLQHIRDEYNARVRKARDGRGR